jgi:uncharacterized protein (DUF1501 family)
MNPGMQRRKFLRLAGLGAVACLVPAPGFAQGGSAYRNVLVLVELKGGNDGLNTIVPYADPAYYALRPRIAVRRDDVAQLDERSGLHPALAPLMPLWQARELALIQGLGYPRPNLSHFRSIEIWDTASASEQFLEQGWLARAFAANPVPGDFAADGVIVGSQELGPLAGGARAIALANTEQFLRQARLAAPAGRTGSGALAHLLKVEADIAQAAAGLNGHYAFRTEFPKGAFGDAVHTAAQIIANKSGVAVLRLTLNGFDTHQNQPGQQANLLRQLAEGLVALKNALQELKRWDSTLIATYAEFGRRAAENNSNGTDHGTANAHFVLGGRVKGGMYGQPPQLERLDNGNLAYAVDFRSVYATILERWWGADAARALGGRFATLDLIRA